MEIAGASSSDHMSATPRAFSARQVEAQREIFLVVAGGHAGENGPTFRARGASRSGSSAETAGRYRGAGCRRGT